MTAGTSRGLEVAKLRALTRQENFGNAHMRARGQCPVVKVSNLGERDVDVSSKPDNRFQGALF